MEAEKPGRVASEQDGEHACSKNDARLHAHRLLCEFTTGPARRN